MSSTPSPIPTRHDGRRNNGGKREGAGRRKRDPKEVQQFMMARGIDPMHAAEVLSRVANERKVWQRLLTSEDDHVVLEAMKFLVSMRDGRPAQSINVTSLQYNLSAEEVARARDIVRELRATMPLLPEATTIDAPATIESEG